MRLSDLQAKDIVSTKDGKRLGRIIDAEIDSKEGKVIYFVVEQKQLIRSFINNSKEDTIYFKDIIKIGQDVILVDL